MSHSLFKCTIIYMKSLCAHIFQVELFTAPTQKKEATEKLHMPNFLAKEVNLNLQYIYIIQNSMKVSS